MADVSAKLFDLGCYEVSLGDTIGIGTSEQTQVMLDTLRGQGLDITKMASHFHNTYSRAIENLVVALCNGVPVIDSSVAGIGGCPYAKGASGNVATEDVLFLLELLGIEHGVDILGVMDTGSFISAAIERENLSKVSLFDLGGIQTLREFVNED